jgi:hypothetical protein
MFSMKFVSLSAQTVNLADTHFLLRTNQEQLLFNVLW